MLGTRLGCGIPLLLSCLFVFQAPSGARAQSDFDTFVTAKMAKAHAPGLAAAIVRDGEVVWTHGYGMADLALGTAVTPDTMFLLAVIGVVTGFAIALLAVGHKVDPWLGVLSLALVIVATVMEYHGKGWGGASHAFELAVVFLALIFVGPGKYSVDRG